MDSTTFTFYYLKSTLFLCILFFYCAQVNGQCALIDSVSFAASNTVFCDAPATVYFSSQTTLNSNPILLQSNVSPNNFQQAFGYSFATNNDGCNYQLTFSGSVTLWGNSSHYDGYSKFNSVTNTMYGVGGLDNYLSPQASSLPTAYNPMHIYNYSYEGDSTSVAFNFSDFPYNDNFGVVNFDWYVVPCFEYLWEFGDGSTSTFENASHEFLDDGSYEVTLTITDRYNNCTSSYSDSIHIYTSPEVTFSGLAESYCASESSIALTGIPEGGSFSGLGISDVSFHPQMVEPNNQLEIIYTYTDSQGCSGADTMQTHVHALPDVTLSGLNSDYCEDDPAQILVASPSGGTLTGPGISGFHFYPNLVNVDEALEIAYSFTDEFGCSNEIQNSTIVHQLPKPDLGYDTTLCFPELIHLYPGPFQIYAWQNSSSNYDQVVAEEGLYYVEVIDEYGCTNSDSILVEMICEMPMYVPNAFTPDFDGTNDIFQPILESNYIDDYRFMIYNKWGEQIFETSDPDGFWDGSYGLTMVDAGTYHWILEWKSIFPAQDDINRHTGNVQVLR